jgi:outer membrane protein TolC
VLGQLTVPIYQGGGEYSTIRQSKETVGQQRLNLDINRDQARATVSANIAKLPELLMNSRSAGSSRPIVTLPIQP